MTRVTLKKGAKIEGLEKRVENPEPMLKQIGAMMVAESQQAFREQAFGGKAWRARGPINVFGIIADFAEGRRSPPDRRFQTRPALVDKGRLAASIAFRLVSQDTVEVGSSLPYAQAHQAGEEVESETITEKVQDRLWDWLQSQGKDRKRALGWLLNAKFRGKRITTQVPKREFVGITKQTIEDVKEVVRVALVEDL